MFGGHLFKIQNCKALITKLLGKKGKQILMPANWICLKGSGKLLIVRCSHSQMSCPPYSDFDYWLLFIMNT